MLCWDRRAHSSTADLPSKHALPFVPAVKDGQSTFGRPSEVFSNPEAASLGFMVLSNQFQADATRLKLNRDPTSSELISALLQNPPKELAKAREVFAYLSSRVSRGLLAHCQLSELTRVVFRLLIVRNLQPPASQDHSRWRQASRAHRCVPPFPPIEKLH